MNDRFVQNKLEMTCVLDTDGYLTFKFTACAPRQGLRFLAGDKWMGDKVNFYFANRVEKRRQMI